MTDLRPLVQRIASTAPGAVPGFGTAELVQLRRIAALVRFEAAEAVAEASIAADRVNRARLGSRERRAALEAHAAARASAIRAMSRDQWARGEVWRVEIERIYGDVQ